jgi:Carboxypeptidase regulatory-like domain
MSIVIPVLRPPLRTAGRGAFALALLLLSGPARAQQTVTQATVSGRVEDASGAAVADAPVHARSLERGLAFATVTDARGRYRFLYLPVDTYELRVEHAPFRPAVRRVGLTVGQAVEVVIRLQVEGGAEEVDVVGEAPLVETVRTQVTETVVPHDIDSLPLNGRNYLDLAALTPAVTRSNPVGNQRFPETSAVPGTGISVTGQRFINNSFVVDGLSSNDDAADLPGTFYTTEVIREFQVISSGGIAEFGRASAGTVNILTQSGTNAWQGRGYAFFRDDALDAKNPLAPTKDPLRQWQYGATAGGPLSTDRTFLFANFEQTRLDSSSVITIPQATVATVNARLDATRYPGPRIGTGLFATGYDSTNILVRLDHRPGPRTLLTARYSLYDITSGNARNVGGINDVSRGTALRDRDQTLAVNLLLNLSASTLNETRFQVTRSRLEAPPNDLIGPAVNISGTANFAVATFSPTARDIDLYQLTNVITTQRGAHALKGGFDFIWNRLDIAFPGAIQGVYTFASLPAFGAGTYQTFQQAFGAETQFQSNPNLGLFVQDEWRARRDLALNVGLRYDLQFLPDPIRTDTGNVSPRVGVAWSPGQGRTVVRASLGLFYDRIPLRASSNALQRDGSKYKVAVLAFGQPGAPSFPTTLSAFPAGVVPSVTTMDPDIQNGNSVQASVQVEHQIARETAASLAYLRVRGRELIMSHNVNVPTLTAAQANAAGIPNLGRPNPAYGNISQYESIGRSWYDGVTLSLRRRFSGFLSARASYTYGKALDDAGNAFFFTPQDNAEPGDDKGRSDNDQRHRLALSGTIEVPKAAADASAFRRFAAGFELGWIYSYGSPLPYNIQTGADRNADTNVNDRPVGVGRNTGVGFEYSSLDLRLSRRVAITNRFRLELLVEAFNALNHANYQLPNNVIGTGTTPRPGYGLPTAAADPRQIQLGLRVSY